MKKILLNSILVTVLLSHQFLYMETTYAVEEVPSCAGGEVYNDFLKTCLATDDNSNFNGKRRVCEAMHDENPNKDDCFKKLSEFVTNKTSNQINLGVEVGDGGFIIPYLALATGFNAYAASTSAWSAYMGVLAGVMAIYNNKNANDQLDENINKIDAKFAEIKKNNEETQGYNLQIESLNKYIQALQISEQSANARVSHHKSEMTSWAVVGTLAVTEVIVCSAAWFSCGDHVPGAIYTGVISAISLGLAMKAKNDASKGAVKYASMTREMSKVRDGYIAYFQPRGLYDPTTATRNMAVSLATQASVARGGVVVAGGAGQQAIGPSDKVCVTATNAIDYNCSSCDADNDSTCRQFSLNAAGFVTQTSQLDPSTLSVLQQSGVILQSNFNPAEQGSAAINKRYDDALALRERVLNRAAKNNQLGKLKLAAFDMVKASEKYLTSKKNKENMNKYASLFSNSHSLSTKKKEFAEVIEKEKNIPKKTEQSQAILSAPVKTSSLDDAFDDAFDDIDDNELNHDSLLAKNEALNDGSDYDYEENQIGRNDRVSIFKMISNRYNILKVDRRIGRKMKVIK